MTTMRIPTRQSCLELLAAAGARPGLVRHSEGVAAAAVELARRVGGDVALCEAAALLHDIGKANAARELMARVPGERAATTEEAGSHDILGGQLLRALGEPFVAVAGIVERHAIDAVLREQPEWRPCTVEEKVVFLADKMVGKRWLGFAGRTGDLLRRYGHVFDTRLCIPGCELIQLELASLAALSPGDLERLVGDVTERSLPARPLARP